MSENTYNGWANYETWNVALWISNDYGLYTMPCEYVARHKDTPNKRGLYLNFARWAGLRGGHTGDDVSWFDENLNHAELDEFMRELVD